MVAAAYLVLGMLCKDIQAGNGEPEFSSVRQLPYACPKVRQLIPGHLQ